MPTFLPIDQFQTILETPNAARRTGLGKRLYSDFDAGAMDEPEMRAASSIFRSLARDQNENVRRGFARFVAPTAGLSDELAIIIAGDPVRDIAEPFLLGGLNIGDDVLVDVAGWGEAWRQIAVAARRVVNIPVSAALSEVGVAESLLTLLKNPGAAMSSAVLGRIAERFGDDEAIAAFLFEHPLLPGRFVEARIHTVSDRLKDFVDQTGWLGPEYSSSALANAVQHSLVDFAVGRKTEELAPLFAKWVAERRITRGFVLRAACYGAMSVLELALGKFAGLPPARVAALMADGSGYGRLSLVARAGFGDEEENFIFRAIARFLDSPPGTSPDAWRLAVADGIEDVLENTLAPEVFVALLEGFATDLGLVAPRPEPWRLNQAA